MNGRKSEPYPILVDKQKILEQKVYATETFPCKKKSGLKKGGGEPKGDCLFFYGLRNELSSKASKLDARAGKIKLE
jgi:hypothetical protein